MSSVDSRTDVSVRALARHTGLGGRQERLRRGQHLLRGPHPRRDVLPHPQHRLRVFVGIPDPPLRFRGGFPDPALRLFAALALPLGLDAHRLFPARRHRHLEVVLDLGAPLLGLDVQPAAALLGLARHRLDFLPSARQHFVALPLGLAAPLVGLGHQLLVPVPEFGRGLLGPRPLVLGGGLRGDEDLIRLVLREPDQPA